MDGNAISSKGRNDPAVILEFDYNHVRVRECAAATAVVNAVDVACHYIPSDMSDSTWL